MKLNYIYKLYLFFLKKIDRKKYAQLIYSHRTSNLKKAGVKIGSDCRIENANFGSEPYLIEIGNHVTIGANVQFVTHDGGVWVIRNKHPEIDLFGKIVIRNNCFIGINSIILPNVTIGENSIVAAGSIVTKDVPSDSIVAGVPAKVINSISNYEEKVLRNGLNTKKMDYAQKKKALISHFNETKRGK